MPSIVHGIWKSTKALKCLTVTKLKNENWVHCEQGDVDVKKEENKSYKDAWLSEHCNDGWMFLNKHPTIQGSRLLDYLIREINDVFEEKERETHRERLEKGYVTRIN